MHKISLSRTFNILLKTKANNLYFLFQLFVNEDRKLWELLLSLFDFVTKPINSSSTDINIQKYLFSRILSLLGVATPIFNKS